jgi:cytosine/adenosine deaminase-related metal-dependent hydrolase
LGRDDIGYLAPGMSADFVGVNLNQLRYAGAHDPVSAMVYCQTGGVDLSVIDGRIVVQDGRLTTLEIEPIFRRHHEIALSMVRGE